MNIIVMAEKLAAGDEVERITTGEIRRAGNISQLYEFCKFKGFKLQLVKNLPCYTIFTDISKGIVYVDISACKAVHIRGFINSFK